MTDGQEAPNDRCCRICGKIGHYVRDCPKNKRNRRQDGKGNVDVFCNMALWLKLAVIVDVANGFDRSVICFYCAEEGHIKRDCPQLKRSDCENDDDGKGYSCMSSCFRSCFFFYLSLVKVL